MKAMTRILSLVLALVLTLSCVPAIAQATEEETALPETEEVIPVEVEEPTEEPTLPETVEEENVQLYAANGTYGENLTWTLDNEGTLTISGVGGVEDCTSSDEIPWDDMRSSIKKIVYSEGISYINSFECYDCENLTDIYIPSTVAWIESGFEDGCYSLEGIWVAPENPYYCSDSNGVFFFKRSDGLLHLNRCPYAYAGIYSIPDNVCYISAWAFDDCNYLTGVSIPESVKTIGDYAFSGSGLQEITIPKTVEEIGHCAFSYCYDLTEIRVDAENPNYSNENGVLFNKEKQSLIQCPAGLEGVYYVPGDVGFIGMQSFAGCDKLTSVIIPENINSISTSVFENCSNLESIVVDPNNEYYCSDSNGVLFNKEKTELIFYPSARQGAYTVPDGVTRVWTSAFFNADGLTAVTIPVSVKEIQSNAFGCCSDLKEIYFMGDAPAMEWFTFYDVKATAYYPESNATWTEEVMNNTVGSITWVPYAVKNGLVKEDGIWNYYKNGVFQSDFEGLVKYGSTYYYVNNGVLDNTYTGVVTKGSVTYYVQKGALKWGAEGLVKCSNGDWYYVKDSRVQTSATTLVKHSGVWYYVANGKMDKTYTGVVTKGGVTYYVYKGTMKFDKDGLVKCGNGDWYYVKDSRVQTGATTLVKYSGTWYYVANGKMDKTYTGVVTKGSVTYYVYKGTMKFNKNGLVKCGNGDWYYVKESRVQSTYTGLVKHTTGDWYYVQKGKINFNFTGVVKHANTLYYVQKGHLDKTFSGTITYNGKKYKVTKGVAKFVAADPVKVTIKEMDHSITKSGNRKLEAIFDLPVLSGGNSEGTATINETMQILYQAYLESLDSAEERLDSAFSGETFAYNMRCVVSYQSENLVCLKYSVEDTVVGYDSESYAGLTFDLATGEILEMQDLFSMDEDDLLDQIKASISKYLKNNGLWDSNSQDVIDSYELYWFDFYINSKGELVVCIAQFELAYSALQIPCGVYVNK